MIYGHRVGWSNTFVSTYVSFSYSDPFAGEFVCKGLPSIAPGRPGMRCSTLTYTLVPSRKQCALGPLNHFLASTAYHTRAINIGPPYTKHVQFMSGGDRSAPLTAGKHRTGTIKITHARATNPQGRENLPRLQGPGRKLSRTKIARIATGIMKAMYCAIAPIEKIAPTATGPAKMRRLRRIPMSASNQTAY